MSRLRTSWRPPSSAFLLAVLFGAVSLLAGAVDRPPGARRRVASALALAAFLLSSLAALVEGLKRFRPLSPFWWYSGHDPLRRGLEPLHVALLVGAIFVFTAAAVVVFRRRDLI